MTKLATGNQTARALIPVVISGGSGTRLWPLSREQRPKQFLPLTGTRSLFQQTLERTRQLGVEAQSPIVVCNATHHELVLSQARAVGIDPAAVVLEPVGRNTAPALALAALLAKHGGAPDPLLLVLPADHVIADTEAFAAAVRTAIDAATSGRLVTFGVVPDRPETGYGYILRGSQQGGWAAIRRFVEKPDLATAQFYVASGEYLWNSGMFLFAAAQLLSELELHAPDILEACRKIAVAATRSGAVVQVGAQFAQCPAKSIDYAVMEKTQHGAVVPLQAGWSDVGSWSSLQDVVGRDSRGNAVAGDVLLEGCNNTYVVGSGRLVAAVGLDDIVVVDTQDAVLVLRRDRAQDVKKIVDALKAAQRNET